MGLAGLFAVRQDGRTRLNQAGSLRSVFDRIAEMV